MPTPRFTALLLVTALAIAGPASASDAAAPHAETAMNVHMIRPVVTALYDNGGQPARDDEALYGMTGAVVAGAGADGFLTVLTSYGYRVRVSADDVLPDADVPGEWRRAATHLVAAPFADILPAPDFKAYPPLLTLPRGALVRVVGAEDDYSAVRLHDGGVGFVKTDQLRETVAWTAAGEAANRARVVADALGYLGTQYRWGGKTPAGIDCSGLVSMAFLMNGLAIYRNATPRAGYPVALLHVDAPAAGHDSRSLAGVKPGDIIYWEGHQALYLGDGKYIHATIRPHCVRVDLLFRGDPSYRADHGGPEAILTWGTVYPQAPEALTVRRFVALPADEKGSYRFFARLDGYAPTRAVLYPEGEGEGKPVLEIADPAGMVYGVMAPENAAAPLYRYATPGKYYPAVRFVNDSGWLPGATAIDTDVFVMTETVVVK